MGVRYVELRRGVMVDPAHVVAVVSGTPTAKALMAGGEYLASDCATPGDLADRLGWVGEVSP